jgi:hypothetical protein
MSMQTRQGSMVVEVVFHVRDEQSGRSLAERMIDRAHEIANLPECECDLDVNVRWSSEGAVGGPTAP